VSDTGSPPGPTWANLIAELRHAHDMTQQQFGDAVGVSRKTVMRWESGTLTNDYEVVARIAERFQVPSATLFALLGDSTVRVEAEPLHPLAAELHRMLTGDTFAERDELEALVDRVMDVYRPAGRRHFQPRRR
jgi:transcriptional regulator with XRE-family HTH domain